MTFSQTVISNLNPDWIDFLAESINAPNFENLCEKLDTENETQTIYPPAELVFNAFDNITPEKVKIIILGQDPYHGPNQAHGLAFSVTHPNPPPPSLSNIFKELFSDLQTNRKNPNLEDWTSQGVLLLNTSLTVRAHTANSHQKLGWIPFTDAIIHKLSLSHPIAFVLWGKNAHNKLPLISTQHNPLILKAPHPSPLSAHQGFFGSKPFSQINSWLVKNNQSPIRWN
jgi:uracil-DNA glycosylase